MLTFRSSVPESKSIVEQQSDGRQRVALATKSHGSERSWELVVHHPSGRTWNGSFNGPTQDVIPALEAMLAKTENEYRNDKARSDRPWSDDRDQNRSVNDGY